MLKLKLLIQRYIDKYKEFPPITWLVEKTELEEGKVQKYLDKLQNKGKINKNNGNGKTYYISQIDAKVATNYNKKIIQIIMLIISLISIIISIYYSSVWFFNFLKDAKAIVWALVLVLYAVFAPQAAVMFWREKKKIFSIVLTVTAVIVILFSIISTVAGQFKFDESRKLRRDKKQKQIVINLLRRREFELLRKQKNIREEIKINMNALKKKYSYWYRSRIDALRKTSKINDKELAKLRAKLTQKYSVKKETQTGDFYTWLSQILPIPAYWLEFILYMFAAIFVDIMAPLGMHIGLQFFEKS